MDSREELELLRKRKRLLELEGKQSASGEGSPAPDVGAPGVFLRELSEQIPGTKRRLADYQAALSGNNPEALSAASLQLARPEYMGGVDAAALGDPEFVAQSEKAQASMNAQADKHPVAKMAGSALSSLSPANPISKINPVKTGKTPADFFGNAAIQQAAYNAGQRASGGETMNPLVAGTLAAATGGLSSKVSSMADTKRLANAIEAGEGTDLLRRKVAGAISQNKKQVAGLSDELQQLMNTSGANYTLGEAELAALKKIAPERASDFSRRGMLNARVKVTPEEYSQLAKEMGKMADYKPKSFELLPPETIAKNQNAASLRNFLRGKIVESLPEGAADDLYGKQEELFGVRGALKKIYKNPDSAFNAGPGSVKRDVLLKAGLGSDAEVYKTARELAQPGLLSSVDVSRPTTYIKPIKKLMYSAMPVMEKLTPEQEVQMAVARSLFSTRDKKEK